MPKKNPQDSDYNEGDFDDQSISPHSREELDEDFDIEEEAEKKKRSQAGEELDDGKI